MIAIISDTHDHLPFVEKTADIIRKRKDVDLVVHCGDVVAASTLKLLEGLNVKLVFGNNDGEKLGMTTTAVKLGFEPPCIYRDFMHDDKRFLVVHNMDSSFIQECLNSQVYDYLLCGHTHIRKDEKVFNTRVINPGGLCFRTDRPSFAFLDAQKDELEFVYL